MIGTLLEKLFVSVGVDMSELGSGMSEASREIGKISRDLKKDFEGVGKAWQDTGKKMIGVGTKLSIGVTAPLVLFGKHATQAAIDAEEMQSAFNVVFGEMADDMTAWAEVTGNAMGRSTQEIQRGALAFQELFGKALAPEKAAEMSKEFAVLTQDLASFKNLSNEVAQQKLFSGLTGEAEPLRAVGVFINEAAVQAKAMELGLKKVNGKFTDQQKIIARAALIREQLSAADGDVLRTSDSMANKIRASEAAFEELSVTVGTVLIPALLPVVEIAADLLNGFNELPSGVQTGIVAFGAFAAILGPITIGIGGLISGIGAMIPLFAAAMPIIGGLVGVLAGLAIAFWPITLAIGAVVAAWYFWDDIKPIIDKVSAAVVEFYSRYLKPTIDAAIEVIKIIANFFKDWFGAQIEGTVKIIAALLKGDFAGAWEAAKEAISRQIDALMKLFGNLGPAVVNFVAAMVQGIKTYLQDRLGAIFDSVGQSVEKVKAFFADLYDAVVGNSYIPDMVDEIGQNMKRLDNVLVKPVEIATSKAKEAFRELAEDTKDLLDSLFPNQARLSRTLADMQLLEKARAQGLVDPGTYRTAREKLAGEAAASRSAIVGMPMPDLGTGPLAKVPEDLQAMVAAITPLPPKITETIMALQDFGEGLGDTLMGSIAQTLTRGGDLWNSVKQNFGRFMDHLIVDGLRQLETQVFGEGGLGGFISTGLTSLLSGGSMAVGGPAVPGRAYNVGLGEKFIPSQHGRILSRSDAMAAMGGGSVIRLEVSPSKYFDAKVIEVTDPRMQAAIGSYDRIIGDRAQNFSDRRG